MLFWMFVFLLDVDHISSQKRQISVFYYCPVFSLSFDTFPLLYNFFSYMGHMAQGMSSMICWKKSIANELFVQQYALITSIKRRSVAQNGWVSVARSSANKTWAAWADSLKAAGVYFPTMGVAIRKHVCTPICLFTYLFTLLLVYLTTLSSDSTHIRPRNRYL